jgi:hypothetical protein
MLKSNAITGLNRLLGIQEVEAPRFLDIRHMQVARFSAQRTGRLYAPAGIAGTHGSIPWPYTSCRSKSIKNSSETIGNRTRDLPVCSAVTNCATACSTHARTHARNLGVSNRRIERPRAVNEGHCWEVCTLAGDVWQLCKVRLRQCLRVGFEVITDVNTRCWPPGMWRRVVDTDILEEPAARVSRLQDIPWNFVTRVPNYTTSHPRRPISYFLYMCVEISAMRMRTQNFSSGGLPRGDI